MMSSDPASDLQLVKDTVQPMLPEFTQFLDDVDSEATD